MYVNMSWTLVKQYVSMYSLPRQAASMITLGPTSDLTTAGTISNPWQHLYMAVTILVTSARSKRVAYEHARLHCAEVKAVSLSLWN